MVNNMEETDKITISKYEYDMLQSSKLKYQMLMQTIFYDSTELTYSKNDLSISANNIIRTVKVLEPVWYNRVLSNYKNEKEENNNDTN